MGNNVVCLSNIRTCPTFGKRVCCFFHFYASVRVCPCLRQTWSCTTVISQTVHVWWRSSTRWSRRRSTTWALRVTSRYRQHASVTVMDIFLSFNKRDLVIQMKITPCQFMSLTCFPFPEIPALTSLSLSPTMEGADNELKDIKYAFQQDSVKNKTKQNLILNPMEGWMGRNVANLFVHFVCKPFLRVWKEKVGSFQISVSMTCCNWFNLITWNCLSRASIVVFVNDSAAL